MPKKRPPHVTRLADVIHEHARAGFYGLCSDLGAEELAALTGTHDSAEQRRVLATRAKEVGDRMTAGVEGLGVRDLGRASWLLTARERYDGMAEDRRLRFRERFTEMLSPNLPTITEAELGELRAGADEIFERRAKQEREAWAVRDRVAGCQLPRVRAILDQVEQLVGFEREQFYLALMDLPDFFVEEPIRGAKHRT
ncbi:MAG TPA: hypothetical protein VM533_18180, partial [Fimbriiglobus sp.]|nr:hypothetical protein [Fimbriiglobus sp.]